MTQSLFPLHIWTLVRAWWGGDVKVCELCGDYWLTTPNREACRG